MGKEKIVGAKCIGGGKGKGNPRSPSENLSDQGHNIKFRKFRYTTHLWYLAGG